MNVGIYKWSTLNRFLSADSILPDFSDPQTLNLHVYVENNPANFSDPSGHCVSEQCEAWKSRWGYGELWREIEEDYEPGLDLNFGPVGSQLAQQYGEGAIGPLHAVFGQDTEIFLSELFLEFSASLYFGIGGGACLQFSPSDPSGLHVELEGGEGIGIEILDVGLEAKKVAALRTDGTASLEYSITGFIFSVADGIQVDPNTLIVRPVGTLLTDELARGEMQAWAALWKFVETVVPPDYVYLGVVLPHPDFPDYQGLVPIHFASPVTVGYPEIPLP